MIQRQNGGKSPVSLLKTKSNYTFNPIAEQDLRSIQTTVPQRVNAALEVMDTFSARPEKIIGNVALASLLAGLPLGLLISAVAAIRYQAQYAGIEIVKNIALGAVVAPVFIFVFGLVVIAPLLTLLRHLGYGGPFFVYAISIGLAVPFLSNGVLSGLAAISMALAASYVFCRFAYSDQLEQLTDL